MINAFTEFTPFSSAATKLKELRFWKVSQYSSYPKDGFIVSHD